MAHHIYNSVYSDCGGGSQVSGHQPYGKTPFQKKKKRIVYHVCACCLRRPGSLGTGVSRYDCWESNLGPLEMKSMLLTNK